VAAPFTSALAAELADDALERFLRYVRVDTQACREHDGTPSSPGQLELGRMLVDELRSLGLDDAAMDDRAYVMATVPGGAGAAPVVGVMAHLDTSPDAPGRGVEPIVHRAYDGGVIRLPLNGTLLDPARMPELREAVGHDIVTSSGDTLLGADDKAGVAAIMAAAAWLVAHPEAPRPRLRIAFTPDEEIGEGAYGFDLERFGASCAYTIDGSERGELQDETFSAIGATVVVHGVEVHPGQATGKLVNALRLAARIVAALPSDSLSPETTSGREGFIHVYEFAGTAGRAEIRAIVRDFNDDQLDAHVALLERIAHEVVDPEPRARLEFTAREQYRNMHSYIERVPFVTAAAAEAIRAEGIEGLSRPIRGGTDGSILSARGLPTPNIFDGGHEYHSPREWISVQDLAASAAVIVRLAEVWSRARLHGLELSGCR
jgi:tripeptide aminopeptidase